MANNHNILKNEETVCSDAGISLKHVAAHEFGHALGLPHLPHKEVLNQIIYSIKRNLIKAENFRMEYP